MATDEVAPAAQEDLDLILGSLIEEWDELDFPPLSPIAARRALELARRYGL